MGADGFAMLPSSSWRASMLKVVAGARCSV